MKTHAEFLEELKKSLNLNIDLINRKLHSEYCSMREADYCEGEKAMAEMALKKVEQFEAEQKQVKDEKR
jgi:hypothetical protein